LVKFSIIIPVKAINDYVRETVPHIQAIKRSDWELIILPNEEDSDEWSDSRVRIIASGRVGPAKKRDIGAKFAAGDILVFLDDDSYPDPDFLDIAERHFADNRVVAVGGPAITPPQDSFWQRVSGAVFLSRFSGGAPERYIPIGAARSVVDWPSVNLMIRRKEFLSAGGFDSDYWPGEDTELCLKLVSGTGKKILYVPDIIVWHHRRAGLVAHLRQIGGYGLHRGYFVKRYPATSRKPLYFLPSAFVVFVIVTLTAAAFTVNIWPLLWAGWCLYGIALSKAWFDIRRYESISVSTVAIFYSVLTHFWYGVRFIQGVATPRLISRLR